MKPASRSCVKYSRLEKINNNMSQQFKVLQEQLNAAHQKSKEQNEIIESMNAVILKHAEQNAQLAEKCIQFKNEIIENHNMSQIYRAKKIGTFTDTPAKVKLKIKQIYYRRDIDNNYTMNLEVSGKVTEIHITDIVQLIQKSHTKLLIDYYVRQRTIEDERQEKSGLTV